MEFSKNRLNFWVDVVMFVDMVCITLIGLIIRYVLPPGTGGRHGGWGLTFLGMSRHDWGDVHWVMALILVALLVVHIWLHWKWIVQQLKRTFRKSTQDSTYETKTN